MLIGRMSYLPSQYVACLDKSLHDPPEKVHTNLHPPQHPRKNDVQWLSNPIHMESLGAPKDRKQVQNIDRLTPFILFILYWTHPKARSYHDYVGKQDLMAGAVHIY